MSGKGQVLLFPGKGTEGKASTIDNPTPASPRPEGPFDVVLVGSFRKNQEGLRRAYDRLIDLGCRVLSPGTVELLTGSDPLGDAGQETIPTSERQLRHLETIQHAHFIWLHCPRGYVGQTTALEIGFARACGVPVFSATTPHDIVLQEFVRVVRSPLDVIVKIVSQELEPPLPALQTIQHYYRRTANERGYEIGSAQHRISLMAEELGELARALQTAHNLIPPEIPTDRQEALALADVFIHVVQMANILCLDLGRAVQNREILNIKKLLDI